MNEIIAWLLTTERLAGAFYRKVAEIFAGDERFSTFFLHLSAEEAWHAKLMEKASQYLVQHVVPDSAIFVDTEIREKIAGLFLKNMELLSSGDVSRENVLDCLAMTEFSEWNHIFVYVISSLTAEEEFASVSARMQGHLREIEHFMKSTPEGHKHLYRIESLPRVWKERILVVDDDLLITEFLANILSCEGHVEIANNGREGLEKIKSTYFDVIVSDIFMPVMDGIEFFGNAQVYDPEVGRRFMFLSASPSVAQADFFRRNNLKFLLKPAPVGEIVRGVSDILHRTPAS